MSKLMTTSKDIKVTADKPVDGHVELTLESTDKGFEKQSTAYGKACEYRGQLVGAVAGAVAENAKELFGSDEEVSVVSGSMEFGPSVLSATVHREFQVEGSDDVIANHVVVGCEDDFTKQVNDAVAGIFDGE